MAIARQRRDGTDKQIQIFIDNAVNIVNQKGASWISLTVADAKTGAIVGSSSSPSSYSVALSERIHVHGLWLFRCLPYICCPVLLRVKVNKDEEQYGAN